MDHQKRIFLFMIISFGILYLWLTVGIPFFHPELQQQNAARQQKKAAEGIAADNESSEPPPKIADKSVAPNAGTNSPTSDELKTDPPIPEENVVQDQPLETYPQRSVFLGSIDPQSKYRMQVELTSCGAAIANLALNDPRYRDLDDNNRPLHLLTELKSTSNVSLENSLNVVDAQLLKSGETLQTVNWQVDDQSLTDQSVTFVFPAPDVSLEVRKTYTLNQSSNPNPDLDEVGHLLDVTLTFINLSESPLDVKYELQGPVGFPLENVENTRRYLDIQLGFLKAGNVSHEQTTAKEVADQVLDAREQQNPALVETYKTPLKYVGVDGQYFAALIIPQADQEETPWIEEVVPQLIGENRDENKSLISVNLISNPVSLQAKETKSFEYQLFAGPKRTELLKPFEAEDIIDFGWFGAFSKLMLSMMNFFHDYFYLPYGLAIIMLTVCVRGAMYPISRKHALAAKKMKDMQPKFEEIRKKYENDKEKLAKAQMELMKESGFFSGCLPMLLQLPIFIGLYNALNNSVDLRMAEFLWINNLAAPDQLFQLPFEIPFLGNDFNLLPILTVALIITQQKLYSPPPANDEQALQQKMMTYMMVFFGFMFYRVPAGLCVYFIASSLWAIAERKILELHDTASDNDKKKPEVTKQPKSNEPKGGWFRDAMSALDAAANPGQKPAGPNTTRKKPKS